MNCHRPGNIRMPSTFSECCEYGELYLAVEVNWLMIFAMSRVPAQHYNDEVVVRCERMNMCLRAMPAMHDRLERSRGLVQAHIDNVLSFIRNAERVPH